MQEEDIHEKGSVMGWNPGMQVFMGQVEENSAMGMKGKWRAISEFLPFTLFWPFVFSF